MATQYWIRTAERTFGPYSSRQLRQMAANGKLKANHEISTDGAHWSAVTNVKGLLDGAFASQAGAQADGDKIAANVSRRGQAETAGVHEFLEFEIQRTAFGIPRSAARMVLTPTECRVDVPSLAENLTIPRDPKEIARCIFFPRHRPMIRLDFERNAYQTFQLSGEAFHALKAWAGYSLPHLKYPRWNREFRSFTVPVGALFALLACVPNLPNIVLAVIGILMLGTGIASLGNCQKRALIRQAILVGSAGIVMLAATYANYGKAIGGVAPQRVALLGVVGGSGAILIAISFLFALFYNHIKPPPAFFSSNDPFLRLLEKSR